MTPSRRQTKKGPKIEPPTAGGVRENVEKKMCLHGPMDYAKKLLLRLRVGEQNLSGRRKRYTSGREEGGVVTHMCPCGTTIESRTHTVGECEYIQEEERDALEEELRTLDEYDMEEFRRLESSEKTIVVPGDRWWPQTAKQNGDRTSKDLYVIYGRSEMSAQMLKVSL